jgi:hypothetical protein
MPPAPEVRSSSGGRERKWLQWVGVLVLVLGLAAAVLVYWRGTRSTASGDDPSLVNYSQATSRQMGVLYGKMGLRIDDLLADLQRPGVQALVIAGISILAASGCFLFARGPNDPADSA